MVTNEHRRIGRDWRWMEYLQLLRRRREAMVAPPILPNMETAMISTTVTPACHVLRVDRSVLRPEYVK